MAVGVTGKPLSSYGQQKKHPKQDELTGGYRDLNLGSCNQLDLSISTKATGEEPRANTHERHMQPACRDEFGFPQPMDPCHKFNFTLINPGRLTTI